MVRIDRGLENKFQKLDRRIVSEDQLETNYIEKPGNQVRVQLADVSNILWLLLIALLIMERIVAKLRKQ